MKISSLVAYPILDSRGGWTVEVVLTLQNGACATASVPQGKSTGATEAKALPAATAVKNINTTIATRIIHKDFLDQAAVDEFLVRLDGTAAKSRLGANAILAVSIAFLRATARTKKMPLWKHVRDEYGIWVDPVASALRPRLFMNVVNGGLHAGNNLHFQEYLIIPKARTFRESIDIGTAIYRALGATLLRGKGLGANNLGDEGGFAPNFKNDLEPFQIIHAVAKRLKLDKKIDFGIDAAATSMKGLSRQQSNNAYKKIIKEYSPVFIEDPFSENDFKNFAIFMAANAGSGAKGKSKLWTAGDAVTATNADRMELAHTKKSVNAVVIKPNQIGTITETLNAVRLARQYGWAVIVSHRSGETNDDFIADFAYGVAADGFKLGAPARGERIAKYNRLLEIESGK
jgi:enolase